MSFIRKNSIVFGLVAILMCVVLLAACGTPEETKTEPTAAPEQAQPAETTEETAEVEEPAAAPSGEPIVFGMVAPMTGDAAEYGTQLESGVQLAIDEINATGGIDGRPVELDICDDKCDPYEASMCAQRMVANEKIFAVIGHVCSSCTLAGGPIYEEAGLTVMTVSSTNPEVTNKGWTHVFRTIAHDGMQGPIMAQFAIETLGQKKLAIMYANSDYGKGLLDATTPEVPKFGGEVVATETYVPGVDKDFSAQLTKIAQASPDALLLLTDYSEGGMITKQRVAAGLGDVPVIASAGNQHSGFLELAGDAGEGAYVMVYFDPESPNPLVQDFLTKYKAKHENMPSEQAAYGYEAPYIYKMAIEMGATKETLNEVMHQVDYTGLTGETKFGDNGDVSGKGQAILIVKDGKFTSYVGEDAAAEPAQEVAAPSGEPIVFGMVAPMTGDAAEYGTQLESGVQLAIDEINAAGGIDGRPVELDICDDKCDPYEASMCAQRMVANEKIFAVIGHVCSSCTLAGGPIYEEAGLTVMTVSSTNPEVTNKGWTHVFRTIAHDGMQGPIMAQFAIETLGQKKLAIMYANSDYGKGLLDATTPEIPKFGGEVVATETYVPGVDKDFSAQLTKIAQMEPDALLLLTDYSEGGMITKQRVAAGLGDVPVIASAGNQHSGFLELGGEAAEGVYTMVYFDPESPNPLVQDFLTKYKAKHENMPSEQAAYGYEAPYIYKMAIEMGATKETLNEVMHQVDYTGLTGETKFGDNGDVSGKGQAILIVKDGKFTSYVP